MLSRLLIASTLLLVLAAPASAQAPEPEATRVYGQPDFSTNAAGHGAAGLSFPIGLALDGSGGLYVADRNNSRILHYAGGTDDDAFRVFGQHGDLASYTQNYDGIGGSGLPSADSLNFPVAITLAADEGLYVTDRENHRVLYYAPDGDATADRVYGQFGSFTTNPPNNNGLGGSGVPSADNIGVFALGVLVDGSGGLYISDSSNNRVLFFEPGDDTTADLVYGQFGSFASGVVNNDGSGQSGTPSASSLNFPRGLALDSDGGLYVADRENHRVLYFADDGDTTADWVFGQFGSFTSNVANNDGSGAAGEPSAQNLNRPQFVLFGADGSLYISDTGNNRVLVLPPDALP